jgi:hypothetical protein
MATPTTWLSARKLVTRTVWSGSAMVVKTCSAVVALPSASVAVTWRWYFVPYSRA